jgi:antitoxin ParD1/3/4
MAKETEIEALRAALIEGERSGASTPFDFDEFIARKRKGKKPQCSGPAPKPGVDES